MSNATRPQVVCLCGSTRFRTEFEAANRTLTLAEYDGPSVRRRKFERELR